MSIYPHKKFSFMLVNPHNLFFIEFVGFFQLLFILQVWFLGWLYFHYLTGILFSWYRGCWFSFYNLPCYQMAGIISISSRFLPTVMNLLRRLAEEAQGHTPEAPRPQQSLASQIFRHQTQQNPVPSSIPESSVPSNISSTDSDVEYSSPNLMLRRSMETKEAEFSWRKSVHCNTCI